MMVIMYSIKSFIFLILLLSFTLTKTKIMYPKNVGAQVAMDFT